MYYTLKVCYVAAHSAQLSSFTVNRKLCCARAAVITADRWWAPITWPRQLWGEPCHLHPAEQRGWNTGHTQSSIRGKGPVFPPRQPPPPPRLKTTWRTKHRPNRGNSPKTPWRRYGCRVKMAFLKNTFLKERVRMKTWRQLLASVSEFLRYWQQRGRLNYI